MGSHILWLIQRRKNIFRSKSFSHICTLILPDLVLGSIVVVLGTWFFSDDYFLQFISNLNLSEYLGTQLHRLLLWLHGSPAGLKLNSPLSDFLGYFYSYHVFIWTNYVDLLVRYFKPFLTVSALTATGLLGFSVTFALLSDILLLFFPHMICFYVYATKLYRMELQMLLVCFRLFKGQKWNPLRNRVDSVHYDFEQLFIGTLLFTVTLFLFPTTCVYYVVFLTLYLPLAISRYFLMTCLNFSVKFPFYLFYKRMTSRYLFRSLDSDNTYIPLTKVHTLVNFSFCDNIPSFSEIANAIITGKVLQL